MSEKELALVAGVLAEPSEVSIEQGAAEQDASAEVADDEIYPASDANADSDISVVVAMGGEMGVDAEDEGGVDVDGGGEESEGREDGEGMDVDEGWDERGDAVDGGEMDEVEEAAVERTACEEVGIVDGSVTGEDDGGGGSGVSEVASSQRGESPRGAKRRQRLPDSRARRRQRLPSRKDVDSEEGHEAVEGGLATTTERKLGRGIYNFFVGSDDPERSPGAVPSAQACAEDLAGGNGSFAADDSGPFSPAAAQPASADPTRRETADEDGPGGDVTMTDKGANATEPAVHLLEETTNPDEEASDVPLESGGRIVEESGAELAAENSTRDGDVMAKSNDNSARVEENVEGDDADDDDDRLSMSESSAVNSNSGSESSFSSDTSRLLSSKVGGRASGIQLGNPLPPVRCQVGQPLSARWLNGVRYHEMSPQVVAAACREHVRMEAEAGRPILNPVPKWFTTILVDYDVRELQHTLGVTGRKGFAASESPRARRTAGYGYSVTDKTAHPPAKDPRRQVSNGVILEGEDFSDSQYS